MFRKKFQTTPNFHPRSSEHQTSLKRESAFALRLAFAAHAVHIKRVVNDAVAVFFRDFVLQGFDFRIVEFRYLAAFHADDMVVVVAFVQFVNRLAGFKMVALQNACLLELGQHAVKSSLRRFPHPLPAKYGTHLRHIKCLFQHATRTNPRFSNADR